MTGAAVSIEHLRVTRGGTLVLPDLSAEIEPHRVTGLLGPSGSGKSTLMRAVVGVQRVDSGRVRVLGDDAGSPALRHRVGYRPQAPSLYGDLTVTENLRYFGRILGVGTSDVIRAVSVVGLDAHATHVVDRLSGGERARVSLAAVLLGRPALLVLDEPTVGLDPVLRRDLWQTFHELADAGTTLLVSSHVMDEAEHCDELLLLRAGEIVAAGTPADLTTRTQTRNLDEAFLQLIDAEPR
ncbi:MAG TPA: ABC transporter ATP-binding protein [Gaiellaceae bacterium]|nr:ABC transporter ATP-binding protein [Gaiellaceae bacterium]